MNGWIKLHRKITEWEWYTDQNTLAVYIHLLIMANVEDKRYRGYDVKRGDCIIGRHKLAADLNMSEQNVRTAINHLISTNEITIKTTNQFTIVTICNYDSYQFVEKQSNQQTNQQDNQQPTNDQPTGNQPLTTPKELKELNKGRMGEERGIGTPKNLEDVIQYAKNMMIDELMAKKFFYYYDAKGWSDLNGRKIANWQSQLQWWFLNDGIKDADKQTNKGGDKFGKEWEAEMIEKMRLQDERKQQQTI